MIGRGLALALPLFAALAGAAAAQRSGADPDWPCPQVKVPEMSLAAMWGGPPIETGMDWRADAAVADLVGRLAERRLPLDQAQTLITQFAAKDGPQRQVRLSALLVGLFDAMNQERGSVLEGLDRYGRRQRDLAESLRTASDTLGKLQAAADRNEAAIDRQREALVWQRRVFDARRQTLNLVCDVPARIEQRLFALTRAIQAVF